MLGSSTVRYHAILSEDAGATAAGARRLGQLAAGMVGKGADMFTAKAEAMRVLDGIIARQAAVLAYNHVLVLVSALFILGFPLVFLLRRGTPTEVEVHVD
jgi:hypothetical protein